MEAYRQFRHCPRCAAETPGEPSPIVFTCAVCGFRYFFGSAVAVAVFVHRPDGQALFIRRAREPGKGKLAPPGGFIDPGETAEAAARREIREEVGLALGTLEFLCSHPNRYLHAEVLYPVLDFFFLAPALNADQAVPLDDVSSLAWLDPRDVAPEEMAFPSMRAALELWQQRLL